MNVKAFVKGMLIGSILLAGVIRIQESKVMAQECEEGCEQPEPVVYTLDLGKDGPNCGQNHFYVNAVLRKDGVAQSGVEVTFKYKAETKKATTNVEGRAEADIAFKGDDQVSAEVGGYPSQSMGVDSKGANNCPAVEEVITKMAATGGITDQVIKTMIGMGMILMVLGAGFYVVKKD